MRHTLPAASSLRPRAARFSTTACLGAVLVAVLAALPASGQDKLEGNAYSNAKYGIQISKPPSWHFITAAAILDLAKKSAGGGRIPGEEDPIKAAGFAVVVSKAPMLGRGVSPQVVLLVRELPAPSADLVKTCESLRGGMVEPETVRSTRQVQVGGRPAARLDFQGLVDGDMVRATALCTLRERQAFMVVGQALSAEFDSDFANFESILGSFRLR
jgi:hypothetical protein